MRITAFTMILISLLTALNGQDLRLKDRKIISRKAIETLKHGTLVVVLNTRRNSIKTLKARIQRFKNKNQPYKNSAAMLSEVKAERDHDMNVLIDEFSNNYKFGKFTFIADTNLTKFHSGNRHCLLDKNKASISIDSDEAVLIMHISRDSEEFSYESFSFIGLDKKAIPSPFPNHFRSDHLIFITESKVFAHRIRKLGKKLERFYKRSQKFQIR